MRSHGPGEACKVERRVPRCEECRAYNRAYDREAKRRQRQIPGTYAYNRSHGIGKPGEVRREARRRNLQTPGTYDYSRGHGIGRPGEMHRTATQRWRNANPAASYLTDLRSYRRRRGQPLPGEEPE